MGPAVLTESPTCPVLIGMLGDNIIVGSWNSVEGRPRWVELDIPTSDCKLAAPDAAFIAETIARLDGASFCTICIFA